MMEAPIRLFEHSKTSRLVPCITAYALTQQATHFSTAKSMEVKSLIVRSNVTSFAASGFDFACPSQGVRA